MNEFDIYQIIDGEKVNQWRWEISQSLLPSPYFRLENSQFSREMTVADLQVQVVINIIERDIAFDEALMSLQQHMDASLESETVQRETSSLGHDGKIRAR